MKQESSCIEDSLIHLLKTLNNMCDKLNVSYKDEFDIKELEQAHHDLNESEE